jgi:uncharacterized membrane protein YcaP (DUF421 family)
MEKHFCDACDIELPKDHAHILIDNGPGLPGFRWELCRNCKLDFDKLLKSLRQSKISEVTK